MSRKAEISDFNGYRISDRKRKLEKFKKHWESRKCSRNQWEKKL